MVSLWHRPRIFLISVLFTILAMCALASPMRAATLGKVNSQYCDYVMSGLFEAGDAKKLEQFLPRYEPIRLCMDSPGGSFSAGVETMKMIWDANIITVVPPGARCLSACALAFMGGSMIYGTGTIRSAERILYPGGQLGIHGPGLTLRHDHSYDSKQVDAAFRVAIEAMRTVYAMNQTKDGGVQPMPDFLISLLLSVPQDDMYIVERIADLVLLDIHLRGAGLEAKELDQSAALNICKSLFVAQEAEQVQKQMFSDSISYFLFALDPFFEMSKQRGDSDIEIYSFMRNLDVDIDRRNNRAWVGKLPSRTKYTDTECMVWLDRRNQPRSQWDETPFGATIEDRFSNSFSADVALQPYATQYGSVTGQPFDNAASFANGRTVPLYFRLPFGLKLSKLDRGLPIDWK